MHGVFSCFCLVCLINNYLVCVIVFLPGVFNSFSWCVYFFLPGVFNSFYLVCLIFFALVCLVGMPWCV